MGTHKIHFHAELFIKSFSSEKTKIKKQEKKKYGNCAEGTVTPASQHLSLL